MSFTVVRGLQSEIFIPTVPPVFWTRVSKSLNEMVVALVTAGGVHLKSDKTFRLALPFTRKKQLNKAVCIV